MSCLVLYWECCRFGGTAYSKPLPLVPQSLLDGVAWWYSHERGGLEDGGGGEGGQLADHDLEEILTFFSFSSSSPYCIMLFFLTERRDDRLRSCVLSWEWSRQCWLVRRIKGLRAFYSRSVLWIGWER